MKVTNAELVDTIEEMREKHALTIRVLTEESCVLSNQLEESHSSREALQDELGQAANYIGGLEQKILHANKTSLDLLKAVRDLELEASTLRNYIIDLKARVAIYVPIKGDLIDQKVADFINNYPDRNKLKIMFMRDSEGVYQFGSRKIKVELANGKIQIRVGGGYLSIDEFLDQHTP